MAVIKTSAYAGEVVWVGQVDPSVDGVRSGQMGEMVLGWDGSAGARHVGRTRPACVRVRELHARDTEIANVRQLTVLSVEELAEIAAGMGIEAVNPEWLGASLVVKGIPDFTHVPPSSRLQGPDGCTLVIDMLNAPCVLPGREVEQDLPGKGRAFKPAAEGRRGVTAWVERPGTLRVGDALTLVVPTQRAWQPGGVGE